MIAMTEEDKQMREEKILKIRQTAIKYLERKDTRFPARKFFKQLDGLKPDRPTKDWIEAVILVLIAGMIKPARVLGMMNSLSKMQKSAGQEQEFNAFADQVSKYLYPYRITSHGFQKFYFSEENNRLALDHIGELIHRFTEIDYTVFLNSGTLLGVVRDGRLIEHDDDVDLAILLKSETRQDAAHEWVSLRKRLDGLGLLGDGESGMNVIYKLKSRGEIDVDLFPCWIEDNRLFIYPHTHGEVAGDALVPTQICHVTGYPIPAQPIPILELNYGKGWSAPDPYFVFPWRRQNALFQGFMDAVQSCLDEANAT